jgi:hypothetical protein
MHKFIKLIKLVIFSTLLGLMLAGCQTTSGGVSIDWGNDRHHQVKNENMPPAHAPAHGRRAQQRYRYHYYPDAEIYFDTGRGLYFYLSDGQWRVSATLPQRLRVRLGEHVSIEMESDKPYSKHAANRDKYPPGQLKKKNKNKNLGYRN